jgi:hypothetical protein
LIDEIRAGLFRHVRCAPGEISNEETDAIFTLVHAHRDIGGHRPTPGGERSGHLRGRRGAARLDGDVLKAVDAAGLSDTLKSAPNITLFAPTDEAFQALPPAELAQLLAPKNAPLLQKILTYHLVNAKVDSSKIKGAKGPVATVENNKVVIDGSTDDLKVNDADIIQSDVMASNGVIQVIDKVLVPPDVSLPAATAATATAPTGG